MIAQALDRHRVAAQPAVGYRSATPLQLARTRAHCPIQSGAGGDPAAAVLPSDIAIGEVLMAQSQLGAAREFPELDGDDRLGHGLESALPAPGKFQPLRRSHFEEMSADANSGPQPGSAHADAIGPA